jgi:hypothetical protein
LLSKAIERRKSSNAQRYFSGSLRKTCVIR